jgi:NAD-dependent DNA ligase
MDTLVRDLNLSDIIPVECPACGGDTVINDTYTKLRCVNRYCIGKVAERFNDFCDHFSVKGIGLSKLTQLINEYDWHNPYSLVEAAISDESDDYFSSIAPSIRPKVIGQLRSIYEHRLTLPELVEALYLPYIGHSSAQKLFSSITKEDWDNNCLNDYLDQDTIQDTMGIVSSNSIMAANIANTIGDFYGDISLAVSIMGGFLEPNNTSFSMIGAYSDKVPTDYARTKRDFYEFVRNNFTNVDINWVNTVTKDCDFLIVGNLDANTNKMKKAMKYGIPVYNEDTFIEYLTEKN